MGKRKPTVGGKKKTRQAEIEAALNGNVDPSNKDLQFAVLSRLITRDLNNVKKTPKFYKYSKDEISKYLKDPYKYEKQLRDALTYIYGASPHFRRLIQYFVGLSDMAYIVSPYRLDPKTANVRKTNLNYRKVLNTMTAMNCKTQFPKLLAPCLLYDVVYCTIWETSDSITIQQLPYDYCSITTIEGNVPNVTFNFQYFDSAPDLLDYYPDEFRIKYEMYKKDSTTRWIELDAPNSFAIKCNSHILDYPLPPFAGVLREIYDLEDYRDMKLSKVALENYAMIAMNLEIDDDGNYKLDYGKAKDFYYNLDSVLPEEVGSVLTPMKLDKISFEKSNTGDTDTIAEAEQNLFTSAGVSSLLFNNPKASANALLLSIKNDQEITFGIVKSIEDAVNRFIQSKSYGKTFKVTFLNCSAYNRDELASAYIKGCQDGLPMVSMYAATLGLGQAELDSMNFLENDVLKLKEDLIPLRTSSTMSSASEEGGAPKKDVGDLTDSGEESREDGDDW